MVTDPHPPTHTHTYTHKQTHPYRQDRLQCTAPLCLARSVQTAVAYTLLELSRICVSAEGWALFSQTCRPGAASLITSLDQSRIAHCSEPQPPPPLHPPPNSRPNATKNRSPISGTRYHAIYTPEQHTDRR